MVFSNQNEEQLQFWKKYKALFSGKVMKASIKETRFIALDTETTGFDYKTDRILSVGAIAIHHGMIDVSDQLELYLEQEVFNKKTVEIHGIRKNINQQKILEKEALNLFLNYIGDSILIAHHAYFDQTMIDRALKRNGFGKLKNKFLDTSVLFKRTKHPVYLSGNPDKNYSLDELCGDLKIPMSDRHTASGDAFITAVAFLKIIAKLKISKSESVRELFRKAW